MKTLLKAADVRNLVGTDSKMLCVDKDAIITQAAKDLAAQMGVTIKRTEVDHGAAPCQSVHTAVPAPRSTGSEPALDGDSIAKIVEQVVAQALTGKPHQQSPVVERDPGGLQLVRGGSVVYESFDTGRPGDKVGIKDLFSIKESPNMGSGFMTMDQSSFDWTLKYDEIDYVIEGVLEFKINGRTYHGQAGDVFYIPANSSVTFSAPGKVKFFYVTYPANWAEL
jgi:ethanolamine utilization protein EutQ